MNVFDEIDADRASKKKNVFDEIDEDLSLEATQPVSRPIGLPGYPNLGPLDSLSDPLGGFAPVVGGDQKESTGRVLGDVGNTLVRDPLVSLAKGVVSVPAAATGLADIVAGGGVGDALERATGYSPKITGEFLEKLHSDEQQAANKDVSDAKGFSGTIEALLKNPTSIAGQVIESLPQMLAGGAVSKGIALIPTLAKAGKLGQIIAGAAGEGVTGAGSTATQAREQSDSGLLTLEQSLLSLASGVATSLLSVVGGKVSQKLGVADVDSAMAGALTTGARKSAAERIVKAMVSEGLVEEMGQSAVEQVFSNLISGKPWQEGVSEAAASGALTGSVTGGVFASSGGGSSPPAGVDQNQATLDAVAEEFNRSRAAEAKPQKQAAPEAMDFARSVADMSADEFRAKGQSFNKQNVDLGLNASDEQLAELIQLRDKSQARSDAGVASNPQTDEDMQRVTTEMAMPQFYKEAIQIAQTIRDQNMDFDNRVPDLSGKKRDLLQFTLKDDQGNRQGTFTISQDALMDIKALENKAKAVRASFNEDNGADFSFAEASKKPSPETTTRLSGASPSVKNRDGSPKGFFHGSYIAGNIKDAGDFKLDRLNKDSLFGPMIYFTDKWSAAAGQPIRNRLRSLVGLQPQGYSTKPTEQRDFFGTPEFTKEQLESPASPGVVSAFLDVKNPLDMERSISQEELAEALSKLPPEIATTIKNKIPPEASGLDLYKSLVSTAEYFYYRYSRSGNENMGSVGPIDFRDGAKPAAGQMVQAMGFDAISYLGGVRRGGVGKHSVIAVFNPSQVLEKSLTPVNKYGGADPKQKGADFSFADKPLNPGGSLESLPQALQDKSNAVQEAMRADFEKLKAQAAASVDTKQTSANIPYVEQTSAGSGIQPAVSSPAEGVEAGRQEDSSEGPRKGSVPNQEVIAASDRYAASVGLPPIKKGLYAKVKESVARAIATAYDALPVFDEKAVPAYRQLEKEINAQWDHAVNDLGVTFESWTEPGQPYANSEEMSRDIRENNHLYFFQGGEPHPLFNVPDQNGITANDKLRAIHDLYGHAAEDFQFGPRGEENAWIKHSQMFSPLAQLALTTETRGQNSWVNFGSQNYDGQRRKNISPKDRPYAVQKVALLPSWATRFDTQQKSANIPYGQQSTAATAGTANTGAEASFALRTEKPGAKSSRPRTLAGKARKLVPGERGGRVTISHWSNVDLTKKKIDPKYHGKGIQGAERLRKAEYPNDFPARSYYGLSGYSPEQGLGPKRHDVEINADHLYDYKSDPDDIYEKAQDEAEKRFPRHFGERYDQAVNTIYERLISEAGYVGYYNGDFSVAAVFKALPGSGKADFSMAGRSPNRTAIDVLSGWPQKGIKPPQRVDFELSADDKAEGASGYSKVFAVADHLSRRVAEAFGALRELTEENAKKIASAMASEVEYAVGKNSKAVGWYGSQMRSAMRSLIERHPDLDGDKGRQAIIRAMIAITSNGQDVQSNFTRADELYGKWKQSGNVEVDGNWGGVNKNAINDGLKMLDKLIGVLGVENLPKFLSGKFTVGELRAAGLNITGEKSSHETFGSLVFGPKIGGGFYQNLSGNFDPVTMDRWFMRTFNRYRGTLTEASLAAIPRQIANLTSVLKSVPGSTQLRADAKRILAAIKSGTFDPYAEADNPGPLLDFAKKKLIEYTANGFRDRSDINRASQRLAEEFFGMNEAPANASERDFIRNSVNKAQQILKGKGINLTNADLQAVLWYLEKEVYGKLGATSKRAEPASYADAAKSIGRKQRDLFEEPERTGSVREEQSTGAETNRFGEVGKAVSPKKTLEVIKRRLLNRALRLSQEQATEESWAEKEPVTRESVQRELMDLQADFPSAVPVVVVNTYNDLPDELHQLAYAQGGNPALIGGVLYDGKVYIVASMMSSLAEARATWLHEQAGHFATDSTLGERLDGFMQQVYDSFKDHPLMEKMRKSYRNGSEIRLGREFIANLSENPTNDPNLWNKIVAMFRQFLRDAGWVKTVSENDIRVLLDSAMNKLMSQDTIVAGNATIFAPSLKMTGYHGTPHKIKDRFRTDRIGTGEGAQVYGWGLYFAQERRTANHYRNTLSTPDYWVDGKQIATDKPLDPVNIAIEKILLMGQDRAEAYASKISNLSGQSSKYWSSVLNKMVELRGKKIEQKAGNLYTVEINFDPENTMDYGGSAADLPEGIYNKLHDYVEKSGMLFDNPDENSPSNYFTAVTIREFLSAGTKLPGYRQSAGEFYENLGYQLNGNKAVSEFLLSLGIKGIKFLDQGSRQSGWVIEYDGKSETLSDREEAMARQEELEAEGYDTVISKPKGTYNYVVFDDGDITITQENGEVFKPEELIENPKRKDASFSFADQPELPGLTEAEKEQQRKATQGRFFTGDYTATDRQQQMADAKKFIEYTPNSEVIDSIAQFASGKSVPGLSQQNVSATIAAVMKRMFAKIGTSKNPAEVAELWRLMDRAKSLAQQEGSVVAQTLEARKVFGEELGFMSPVLAFRGLAQKAWAAAFGLPEGQSAEEVVSGTTRTATQEAGEEVQDEIEESEAEGLAQRIINEFAKSQSDTLSWPKKADASVKEVVKWFVLGDITDSEFSSTMDMLGIAKGTTDILLSVSQRERAIRKQWDDAKPKEAQDRKKNQAEMRKLRAQAMIALRLGATAENQVDAVISEFAKSQSDTPPAERAKQANGVKEAVKGMLNGDIKESEFDATLENIGIAATKRRILTSIVKREIEIRKQWKLQKEKEKQSALTAALLKSDSKIAAILNKAASEGGINWSELFLDESRATQKERREHLLAEIRKHPKLQGLTPEQSVMLENALSKAWEAARMQVFKREFAKRIKLPTVEAGEKLFKKVLPELIRQANLGTLDDSAFLNAFAKELGLPSLTGEAATKLTKLAQEAQTKPEGVLQNKILQQMIDVIQQSTPAHPLDIVRDYWYNNALSGTRTLTAILTGSWIHGAIMAAQQAMDAAILKRRPGTAGRILQAFLSDSLEGVANGWDVFKTGDYTRRAEFSGNINRLLSGQGKLDSLEGWLKHGNNWQKALGLTSYVRRAVVGLDYVGAIGTRGSGVIYNALLDSPEELQKAMTRFDKEKSAQAKKQAQAELGPDAKWVDVRARQLEILEAGISQQVKDNATVLGEIAALNAQPVGWGGVVYRLLESMPRAIQMGTGSSKPAAAFTAFVTKTAAGLAFARAAINMTQSASNWMPIVGGVNYARAIIGKKAPHMHWSRVFGILDNEGNPIPDDRRRLIAAAQVSGLALAAIAYAMTRGGGDDDEDKFDVSGSWYGLTPQQRKDKIEAGERPLSIRVGGRWINYGNLPFGGALAMIGNMRDKERKDGKRMSPDESMTRMVDAWASGLFYIKDLSVVSGLSRTLGISAMNTDESASALNRLVAQQAGNVAGLIPFNSTLREIDTFFDPNTYKPTSGIDYWIRGFPFVRRLVGEGPEYGMAGLPVENMLTPQSRIVAAKAKRDPVVAALSSIISKGGFPHHPDPSPTWIKNGQQLSAKDLPKESYEYQTTVIKRWREVMLVDADYLKTVTPDEYEEYFKESLAPIRDEVKMDIQEKIDPEALDAKGKVIKEYRK